MSDRGEKKAGPPAGGGAETGESLDKVRDILFGSQMRTVERRLGQLEERFLRELTAVRSELERQLGALEVNARKGSAAFDEKLKNEQVKRGDEIKALRAELKEGLKGLDRALSQLQAATGQEDRELRDRLLEQGKSLAGELRRLAEQFAADLKGAVVELRSEKTDTASLVELLTEMAQRLSGDLAGPAGG